MPPGERIRSVLTASDDGRLLASGTCGLDSGATPIEIVRDGVPEITDVIGSPLGFDTHGDLVLAEGCFHGDVVRLHAGGALERLVARPTTSRVTPDGRHLVALEQREAPVQQSIRAIDLTTLGEQAFLVDGDWSLTQLGGNQFAVFEHVPVGETRVRPGVLSLDEGWLGVLEPLAAGP
jgi:hypothetical protein